MFASDETSSAGRMELCIEAARAGSTEALGKLLEGCRPLLLFLANKEMLPALHGKVAPSDIVQDTFLKAQREFEQFRGSTEEELLGWLRRILLNNLANCNRHFLQTEKRKLALEVRIQASPAAGHGDDIAVDGADTPSTAAVAREERAAMERALSQLPPHYRQVIIWKTWELLSFEDIGQRLDKSANAARKVWVRAIEQLQEILEPPHGSA